MKRLQLITKELWYGEEPLFKCVLYFTEGFVILWPSIINKDFL